MAAKSLIEFLDGQKIDYNVIFHSTAYTAQETASRSHIPREELAKTVIVRLDGTLVMAVVPASRHVDIAALRVATESKTARIVTESDFKRRFPDRDIGAMPSFGNLYAMAVFVDKSLTFDKEIAFNACSHNELVRMSCDDFARLVKPKVLKFAAKGAQAVNLDERLW